MKLQPIYVSILSGFLFALSFVVSFLWWCFVPAFVLFLYAITTETSLKRIFFLGWAVGTLHYAGSFFWVWSSIPIMWMQDGNIALQFTAIGYYWTLTSLAVGLGGGIAAVAIKKIGHNSWSLIALVPVIWVASEVEGFLMRDSAMGTSAICLQKARSCFGWQT
jgi:apolipoprotein N-acyltransferase